MNSKPPPSSPKREWTAGTVQSSSTAVPTAGVPGTFRLENQAIGIFAVMLGRLSFQVTPLTVCGPLPLGAGAT